MNAVGRLLVAALAGCASESNEVAKPEAATDSSRTDAETGTLPTDAAVECSLATGCASPACVVVTGSLVDLDRCCATSTRNYCVKNLGAEKLVSCFVLEDGRLGVFGDRSPEQLGLSACSSAQRTKALACTGSCP
ncbi:MAG: hypothetical protein JNL79_06685 [Myxococcales bacterium]|nr:hypothetical protein [Myxococcales bacterium]